MKARRKDAGRDIVSIRSFSGFLQGFEVVEVVVEFVRLCGSVQRRPYC